MKKIITTLDGLYINSIAFMLPSLAGRHGFKLFCKPFRTPLKNYQKDFLFSAEQFTFDHDGINIQGYRWGNGSKKIVFLHGWQSHTFRWKAYIEALSKEDFTIYAIDAPGHGLSGGSYLSVPYYSAVIQQLMGTIGEVHSIISHSVGSFSALHAFHQQPTLPVSKLVLMAPPGEASDFIEFYKKTLNLSERSIDLILTYFEKFLGKPIHHYSSAKFAGDVPVPGLIIHDEEDLETPYHYALAIHDRWKNSTLITTKGLGHNLKSKKVIQDVLNFVTEPSAKPVMVLNEIS